MTQEEHVLTSCWRGAGDCCTDEVTQRWETYEASGDETETNYTRTRTYYLLKRSRWLLHGRSSTRMRKILGKGRRKTRNMEARPTSKKIVLEASIRTTLAISATTKSRRPYCTICHFISTLVDRGIKCKYCRCRAPLREQIDNIQTKLPGFRVCSNSGSIY